jgi:hypothetical protein
MLLRDVPKHPAYVVFHDAYDNGAMDVWPATSLASAQGRVDVANSELDAMGQDECGFYRAYTKLPRKKVWKFYN